MTIPGGKSEALRMEALIRRYFDGCNEADVEKMTSCFTPDAVHYFPPDMYDGPWVGAETIARKWQAACRQDRLVLDPGQHCGGRRPGRGGSSSELTSRRRMAPCCVAPSGTCSTGRPASSKSCGPTTPPRRRPASRGWSWEDTTTGVGGTPWRRRREPGSRTVAAPVLALAVVPA